jgi:hypothetical protein
MAAGTRSATERELVRAAAHAILARPGGDPRRFDGDRAYRQMARGTLAALDWVEGRRRTSPASGEVARPEDVIERTLLGVTSRQTALSREIGRAQDWGSGHVRPPNEDMHYHGAVWSLLRWWSSTDPALDLAIDVPGLAPSPMDI